MTPPDAMTREERLDLPIWTGWAVARAMTMIRASVVLRAWWTSRGWMGEA